MEGLEQRLDGASWETGRLLESPNGRELSNFPAATQRMISRARLRIFHAIPREPGTWPLAGKADVNQNATASNVFIQSNDSTVGKII